MFSSLRISFIASVAFTTFTTTFAAPTIAPAIELDNRDVSAACGGLPNAVSDYVNFTLTALYKNIPNDNITGIPLVVGQAGAISGEELKVFSTFASYPFLDLFQLHLAKGGITATGNGTGSEPHFVVTTPEEPPAEDVYCALVSTSANGSPNSQFPRLAIGPDSDSFSLCPDGSQVNVFYKPSESQEGCEPVDLLMISL
ncbi:hypothetical protein C8Q75DRAFT_731813 [Abortiporus biennis]|nr:hypothetical protein C8Q75DRAFT_731813 [Abortiporus biennis]